MNPLEVRETKWSVQQIQALSKRIYGNCSDDAVLQKLAELHEHFRKYDESFLGLHNRHEWAEVERLAEEICEMTQSGIASK